MPSATLRRVLRNVTVTAAAATALVLGGGSAQAVDIKTVTDNYLFDKSLSQFVSIRADKPYATQLDWSSDACSWSPDQPLGYDFKRACWRHDFGYRNYKKQSRFTETNRLKIDNKFKSDMYSVCGSSWTCKRAADIYYKAVREFGAS